MVGFECCVGQREWRIKLMDGEWMESGVLESRGVASAKWRRKLESLVASPVVCWRSVREDGNSGC